MDVKNTLAYSGKKPSWDACDVIMILSACFQIIIASFVFMQHFDHTICEISVWHNTVNTSKYSLQFIFTLIAPVVSDRASVRQANVSLNFHK